MEKNATKNKKILLVLIVLVILVAIGAGIFIFTKVSNSKKASKGEEDNVAKSFFLSDSNGLYALFNADGKKLTDFIFSEVKEFSNGVATVKRSDTKEMAIIKDNGKYLVDFGKYETIYQFGSLFSVYDSEGYYIINSEGKKVFDKNYSIESHDSKDKIYVVSNDNEINIVDYKGNFLDILEKSDDDDTVDILESKGKYGICIYKKKAYVYDLEKSNKLFEIDSNGKKTSIQNYYLDYISEENNAIILNPFGNEYYVYKDGKLKFTIDTKDVSSYFKFYKDGITAREKNSGTNKYLLYDYDGNKIADNVVLVKDTKNYATFDNSRKLKFYKNNEVVKEMNLKGTDSLEVSFQGPDSVVLMRSVSNKNTYYDSEGNKINENPYYSADIFQPNGYAIVTDEESNEYWIDKSNKKVSEEYDNIKTYEISSDDDKSKCWITTIGEENVLLSYDLKKVVAKDFSEIKKTGKKNIALLTSSDVVKLFDLEKGKVITEIKTKIDNIETKEDYLIVQENGKQAYYSYTTGKIFYEK